MSLFNTRERFGVLPRILHWTIFALFCAQFYFMNSRENLPAEHMDRGWYMMMHKSVGMTTLMIVLLFILFRFLGQRPQWHQMSLWESVLARVVHAALYLMMFAIPLTGFLTSCYAGYATTLFGQIELPLFVAQNIPVAKMMKSYHFLFLDVFWVVLCLHILGALKHHYVDRNDILARMTIYRKK